MLELRRGEGWLRISRPYLDFTLRFEFKATTPNSDGGVVVRSWPTRAGWPDRGYRLSLPTETPTDVSSVFAGRREQVIVVQEGHLNLRASDEWQHVEVTGEGPRITLRLNGTVAGVYEVGSFGGFILFDNRKGRLQLRNISVESIERNSEWPENVMTAEQVIDAGGQPPKLVRPEAKPNYTPEAMRRQVDGKVTLQGIVSADGSPGVIRVIRSLDADLDVSAIAAFREWKFSPAVINGKPVPASVYVEMAFTLLK